MDRESWMAKHCKQRYSVLLVIREMQIKLQRNIIPIRLEKSTRFHNTKSYQDSGAMGLLVCA